MADQASDFMKQSQAMAQQSWEQWMRYLQQAAPQQPASPFAGMGAGFAPATPMFGMGAAPSAPMNDVLERSLTGIKGYLDWMQRAASSQADPMGTNWQAQMQQLFGNAGQPFAQAFSGIDSTAAQGFAKQWQAWLAAAGQGGLAGAEWQKPAPMPAFGLHREQQEKHQALMGAMLDSAEQQRRYQALILRANTQGLERLQNKLAEHSEPGRQIESLKALYDLWIDSAEEAYAQIALSDEFREVYGAMVNAQMLERQLMQQQLEELYRQLGLPTRSEVDSLGKRLQEVRREQRAANRGADASGELAGLRAEVAALKKRLASTDASVLTVLGPDHNARATPSKRSAAAKRPTVKTAAVKKAAAKKVAATRIAMTKASAKQSTSKKAPAKKFAVKKLTTKSTAAKRTAAKRAAPAPASAARKRSSASAPSTSARSVAPASPPAGSSSRKKAAAPMGSKVGTPVRPGIPAPRRAKRK